MTKAVTAKFRNITNEVRGAEYGLAGPRVVEPDGVIEVLEDVDRKGRKVVDRWGNVLLDRSDHTYADSYRDQPTIWAEIFPPTTTSTTTPAKTNTTDAGADTEGDKP